MKQRVFFRCLTTFFCLSLCLYTPLLVGQTLSGKLDSFYNALAVDGRINGNVLVALNGKVLYKRSFGKAGMDPKVLNTDETRFNMASVSKTFTSVAVFQLIEQHKLRLDQQLKTYLPEFPFSGVSIRHLLSHTSGLPNTEELFTPLLQREGEHRVSNAELLSALKAYGKPLHFPPGEKYEYCNTGFSLLALLVENVTGQPFATYLKRAVFLPAGMTHTTVGAPAAGAQAVVAKAFVKPIPYLPKMEAVEQVAELRKWTFNWSRLTGQGNVYSTTADMLAFDQALYAGKLVHASSLEQMFTPVRLNNGSIPYFKAGIDEAAYGLGWFIFKNEQDGKVVWHSGGIPGMNTFVLRNLKTRALIVTADNAQNATIAPETYLMLTGKPFLYKRSLAFVYAGMLLQEGTDAASASLAALRGNDEYVLNEGELNYFGLRLFQDGHQAAGLEALKINAFIFPESFNVYDSYGEVLLKAGRPAAARLMYQRSVGLNPKNESGVKALKALAGISP
jgi:CubicO group peptidase (beta-lactamase class C family)